MGRYVHMCWKVHTGAAAGYAAVRLCIASSGRRHVQGQALARNEGDVVRCTAGSGRQGWMSALWGQNESSHCALSPSRTGSSGSPDAHTQHDAMQAAAAAAPSAAHMQPSKQQAPPSHATFQTASIPCSHANFQKDTVSAPSPVPSRQKPAFTVNNEPQLMYPGTKQLQVEAGRGGVGEGEEGRLGAARAGQGKRGRGAPPAAGMAQGGLDDLRPWRASMPKLLPVKAHPSVASSGQ